MQVRVCICWTVVVDDDVYTLDINTTAKDIGGDQNTLFKGFECGISTDTVVEHQQMPYWPKSNNTYRSSCCNPE